MKNGPKSAFIHISTICSNKISGSNRILIASDLNTYRSNQKTKTKKAKKMAKTLTNTLYVYVLYIIRKPMTRQVRLHPKTIFKNIQKGPKSAFLSHINHILYQNWWILSMYNLNTYKHNINQNAAKHDTPGPLYQIN